MSSTRVPMVSTWLSGPSQRRNGYELCIENDEFCIKVGLCDALADMGGPEVDDPDWGAGAKRYKSIEAAALVNHPRTMVLDDPQVSRPS